ncbi:MAG: hypothetical protein ABIH72_01300 [archaeon]
MEEQDRLGETFGPFEERGRFEYAFGPFEAVRTADFMGVWRLGDLVELPKFVEEKRLDINDSNRLAVEERYVGIYSSLGYKINSLIANLEENVREKGEILKQGHYRDSLKNRISNKLILLYEFCKENLRENYGIEDIFTTGMIALGYVPGETDEESIRDKFSRKGIERIKVFSLSDIPDFFDKKKKIRSSISKFLKEAIEKRKISGDNNLVYPINYRKDEMGEYLREKFQEVKDQLDMFGLSRDEYLNLCADGMFIECVDKGEIIPALGAILNLDISEFVESDIPRGEF